jgi:acyl-CoA thioester hydrolase
MTGEDLLKETCIRVRVIYADTDAMGIVYHANYLKWFEMGRTELMRSMGIVNSDIEASKLYFPVSESFCHYLNPARYDDLLTIKTEVAYIRRASIRFNYEIQDESGEMKMAEGYTLHAFTDGEGRIRRIPEDIVKKINKGEGEFQW